MKKICLLLSVCTVCSCATVPTGKGVVSIHLHDSPQNAGGFSSGIDADTIRAVAGGTIIPRGRITIAKITDPNAKADPGSPNDEFLVTLDPDVPTVTYGQDIHLFVRDKARNLTAFRLLRKPDGGHDWQELTGSEAENLHTKYFEHLKRWRTIWNTTKEYDLDGVHGGFLVKDGDVVCGWGMDSWRLYKVTGSRLKELQSLGLEYVAKVECSIWGSVDNKDETVDIRDYRIQKIYPRR